MGLDGPKWSQDCKKKGLANKKMGARWLWMVRGVKL